MCCALYVACCALRVACRGPISDVRPRSTGTGNVKFFVNTEWGRQFDFKCTSERECRQWVAVIRKAIAYWSVEGREYQASPSLGRRSRSRGTGGHAGARAGAGAGAGSDDVDSDEDDDDEVEGGVQLTPWLLRFRRMDEAGRVEALQDVVVTYFRGVMDEDDQPILAKVVDAGEKLRERLEDLQDTCMQLSKPARTELMRPIVRHFSLKMLQEFAPFITGTGPARLNPEMLLQVIDSLEAYNVTRRRVTQALVPEDGEDSRDELLQSTVNDAIDRYMGKMGPKLHGYAEEILAGLLGDKSGVQVKPRVGTRLGTSAPTDLFHFMRESLELVRHKSSPTLQRRILSLVMTEVTLFSQKVLTDLRSTWESDKSSVSLAYICGIINDTGTLLDHMEHMESFFAHALDLERQKRLGFAAPADGDDPPDDLTAIEQDLPRSKTEILAGGYQLVGVLVSIVTSDLTDTLAQVFGPNWLTGSNMQEACVTCKDYFDDLNPILDPFFFERVAVTVLAHICDSYLTRLFSMRKGRVSSFFSAFKLTPDRLAKLINDVDTLETYFRPYMPRESLVLATRLLTFIKDMVNTSETGLLDMFEMGVRRHPHCALHVFMAFETCVNLRPDLDKKTRAALEQQAQQDAVDFGLPPNDDDLMSIMCSETSATWKPEDITARTLHALFPAARDRAPEFL